MPLKRSAAPDRRPEVVLFDLGGVLMDFGGLGRLASLTGEPVSSEMDRRWAASHWLNMFERGRCAAESFSAGVIGEWGLALTPKEFLAEFREWPTGPFPGAVELVTELKPRVPLGCLSNTNPIHWQLHLERWGLVQHFSGHFVSHEMGMMKPEPEVYEAVIGQLDIDPAAVLFLDDREENVVAARTAGINAYRTCGLAAVTDVLASQDLL